MAWIPAVTTGVSLGAQLLGRKKKPNIAAILARLRAFRPEGYLTGADVGEGERIRGRGTASAERSGELARIAGIRRAIQTGTLRSPATGRGLRAVEQDVARGREHAYDVGQEFLGGRFRENLGFERQKGISAFSAELGQAVREQDQQAAGNAAFWNSWLPGLSEIAPAFGAGGARATPTAKPIDYSPDRWSE